MALTQTNKDLLAALKALVAMYDRGTRDLIGPSVRAKLAAADAAIASAEAANV